MGEQCTGTGSHKMSIDLNLAQTRSVEVQDHATDPLVPNQQIGTTAQNMDWNLFLMTGDDHIDQFFPRAGTNKELRRPAHLEPGMLGQQLIPLGNLGEIFE
jgi:hypothetical protein